MQANSTNHVYASCAHILNPSCVVLNDSWSWCGCFIHVSLIQTTLPLPVVVHFHLMRCAILSCFNFLAHLLCALVIYLLSKLCCNKILTICFISSDLHLSLPIFSCPFYMLLAVFLFSFTSFYSIRLCLHWFFHFDAHSCMHTRLSIFFHYHLFLFLSHAREQTHTHIHTCLYHINTHSHSLTQLIHQLMILR